MIIALGSGSRAGRAGPATEVRWVVVHVSRLLTAGSRVTGVSGDPESSDGRGPRGSRASRAGPGGWWCMKLSLGRDG